MIALKGWLKSKCTFLIIYSYGGPAVEPVNTVTKSVKLVVPVDYRSYPDMKVHIPAFFKNYENLSVRKFFLYQTFFMNFA